MNERQCPTISLIALSKPRLRTRSGSPLHLHLDRGRLYVAADVDLLSRRVVGWAMKAEMTAQLVTVALIMEIWRRGKPDSLLHHSDQGSQYTSEQFQHLMADHGITCSMSQSGNVWDNAAMESFFSMLKTEHTILDNGTRHWPI